MRISGTDVMAVAVIATCGAAGLAFSLALGSDGSRSTTTFTVTTDFETAENTLVGERVQRIRTDESGVHIEREVDGERHVERVTGATVIRIRGDADAVEPSAEVQVRERRRVRFESNGEAIEPLVYVDGVRFEGGVESLDPDEIERIEVVKGAAALELFGEAAGGGVIQIFMKNTPARNPGR